MDVENSALTDVGCLRDRNEDAFFASDEMKLYVVSDGMGGHRAGDVASRLAVEGVREYMARPPEKTLQPVDASVLSPEALRLVGAINHANSMVWLASHDGEACQGMGATVSAVWIRGNAFVAANVGDSPVYCIHGGSIEMVSVQHNLALGQDGPIGACGKNLLTRAVGVHERVVPDVCESQCYPGDRFVICSDGLSNRVSESEILQAVQELSPGEATQRLVALSKARGGEDNITLVLVSVGGRQKGGLAAWMVRMAGRFWPLQGGHSM